MCSLGSATARVDAAARGSRRAAHRPRPRVFAHDPYILFLTALPARETYAGAPIQTAVRSGGVLPIGMTLASAASRTELPSPSVFGPHLEIKPDQPEGRLHERALLAARKLRKRRDRVAAAVPS